MDFSRCEEHDENMMALLYTQNSKNRAGSGRDSSVRKSDLYALVSNDQLLAKRLKREAEAVANK